MSTSNPSLENNFNNNSTNSKEIDNLKASLTYPNPKTKQYNISQETSCSHSYTQDNSEKRERSNSNNVGQLDDMFMGLIKRIKKEKQQTSVQKNSISRYYNYLYKSRIQSTIELNNVNPITNQNTLKQTNPISTGIIY
jgi:hypothetical protein